MKLPDLWRTIIALALLVQVADAGVIYLGGHVKTRAYSGLITEAGTVEDTFQVESLPFIESATTASGQTSGAVDYDLTNSGGGSVFRWDVAQFQDGGFESFSAATGELSFQVEEETEATYEALYSYLGTGWKFFRFWIYDTPHDGTPIFDWRIQADVVDEGTVPMHGNVTLVPGPIYRLNYNILIDVRSASGAGEAAASLEFTIGAPDAPALPGDADGDGRVDLTDLNLVRNNFGGEGEDIPGDTHPFDGRVDLADLNAVRNHFGSALPDAVPEPGGAILAGLSFAALVLWARR